MKITRLLKNKTNFLFKKIAQCISPVQISFLRKLFTKNTMPLGFRKGSLFLNKTQKIRKKALRPFSKDIQKKPYSINSEKEKRRRMFFKWKYKFFHLKFKNIRWKNIRVPDFLLKKYKRKIFFFPAVAKFPVRWSNIFSKVAHTDLKFTNESGHLTMPPANLPWSSGSKKSFLDFYNDSMMLYRYDLAFVQYPDRTRYNNVVVLFHKREAFVPPRYLYFISNHWTPYYYTVFKIISLWMKKKTAEQLTTALFARIKTNKALFLHKSPWKIRSDCATLKVKKKMKAFFLKNTKSFIFPFSKKRIFKKPPVIQRDTNWFFIFKKKKLIHRTFLKLPRKNFSNGKELKAFAYSFNKEIIQQTSIRNNTSYKPIFAKSLLFNNKQQLVKDGARKLKVFLKNCFKIKKEDAIFRKQTRFLNKKNYRLEQKKKRERRSYRYFMWHYNPFLIGSSLFKKKKRWFQLFGGMFNWKILMQKIKQTRYSKRLTNVFHVRQQLKRNLWKKRKRLIADQVKQQKKFKSNGALSNKRSNMVFKAILKIRPWADQKFQKFEEELDCMGCFSPTTKSYNNFFLRFINKKNYNFKKLLHSNQLKKINFSKIRMSHRLGSFSLNKKIYFLQLTKYYKWFCKVFPKVRQWNNFYIVYKFDHTQKNPKRYYSISRWDCKVNRWLSPITHNRKLFWYHLPIVITLEKRHPHRYKSYKVYKWYTKTMSNKWRYGMHAKKNYRLKQILFGRIILPALDYLKKNQFLFIKKNVARVKPLGLQHSRPSLFLGKFERRIDILAYKLNFAPTVQWARSFVESGLIYVSSLLYLRTKNFKNILTKQQRFPLLENLRTNTNFLENNLFNGAGFFRKTSLRSQRYWNMPVAVTLASYRVKLKSIIHWSSRNIRTIFFKKLCKRYMPRYFIYNKNRTIAYFWRNLNLIDIDRQRSETRIKWNTMKWMM